ncbi:unnamed protein product, partial [Didymodactylos carnosus]
MALYQSDFCQ